MILTQRLLDELKKQSDVTWYQSLHTSPKGGLMIASIATSEEQANKILAQLNPKLGAKLHASSEAGKWRVHVELEKIEELLEKNEPFSITPLQGLLYTQLAKDWHGHNSVFFRGHQWEQFGAEVDFSEPTTPAKMVSLISNASAERLFFDQSSPILQHIIRNIESLSKGKSIEEVLEIVNTYIDDLSTKHPNVAHLTRPQVEDDLDQRLVDYIEKSKNAQDPKKPNPDITMDELIKHGLLVCRHKAVLAASVLGALVQKKILPQGSARQYRNIIHDINGRETGAHAWAVYHDATTNIMRVIDPRWLHVKLVDPKKPEDIGYGVPAVREMIQRIEALDIPKIESVLKTAIQNAKSIAELSQLMQNFAQKHDIVTTNGTVWKEHQKHKLLNDLKYFSESPDYIMLIAKDDIISSQITRNYGLREKLIALAKEISPLMRIVKNVQEGLEHLTTTLPDNFSNKLIKPYLIILNELLKMPLSKEDLKEKLKDTLKEMELLSLRDNTGHLTFTIAQQALEAISSTATEDALLRDKAILRGFENKKNEQKMNQDIIDKPKLIDAAEVNKIVNKFVLNIA